MASWGAQATPGAGGQGEQAGAPAALLLLNLTGVQQLIKHARTTADLWAGSWLAADLMQAAARQVTARGGELILPASLGGTAAQGGGPAGFPNRLAAAVPAGAAGRQLAEAAATAARERWREHVQRAFPDPGQAPGEEVAALAAVRWVLVEREPGSTYASLWERAQQALSSRKRLRDFPPYQAVATPEAACALCALRAGMPALPQRLPRRAGEVLCAACAAKRALYGTQQGRFPSTASVASAPFRARLTERLRAGDQQAAQLCGQLANRYRELCGLLEGRGGVLLPSSPEALPALAPRAGDGQAIRTFLEVDGAWCYSRSWEPRAVLRGAGVQGEPDAELEQACTAGEELVRQLHEHAKPGPTPYLALLVQDADGMGKRLGEGPAGAPFTAAWHRQVAARLEDARQQQVAVIEQGSHLGRVVYAGGDDLLALLPVKTVLQAAQQAREALGTTLAPALPDVTASSAIVLFHMTFPLQQAVERARRALEEAKQRPGKDRLALVLIRRSGERARAVLPWRAWSGGRQQWVTEPLAELARAFQEQRLSPGLIADLDAERWGLAGLTHPQDRRAEVRRLVRRHHAGPGGSPHADALASAVLALGPRDQHVSRLAGELTGWLGALLVARFIAQEGR